MRAIATSSSTELECVFFSCTPISGSKSNDARLNFKLTRQLVDSYFLHRRDCWITPYITATCGLLFNVFPWYQTHWSPSFLRTDQVPQGGWRSGQAFHPSQIQNFTFVGLIEKRRFMGRQIAFEHSCFDIFEAAGASDSTNRSLHRLRQSDSSIAVSIPSASTGAASLWILILAVEGDHRRLNFADHALIDIRNGFQFLGGHGAEPLHCSDAAAPVFQQSLRPSHGPSVRKPAHLR